MTNPLANSGGSSGRRSARRGNPFPELSPIDKAPSLFTLNGFGFKLYGKTDFDVETNSYMVTHYFVALFVPLFPIARYRVISDDGYSYRFIGKGALRGMDKIHIAAFALALLILIKGSRSH